MFHPFLPYKHPFNEGVAARTVRIDSLEIVVRVSDVGSICHHEPVWLIEGKDSRSIRNEKYNQSGKVNGRRGLGGKGSESTRVDSSSDETGHDF